MEDGYLGQVIPSQFGWSLFTMEGWAHFERDEKGAFERRQEEVLRFKRAQREKRDRRAKFIIENDLFEALYMD